jgi:hypothetical protein
LKKTDDGASTYLAIIPGLLSLFRPTTASAYRPGFASAIRRHLEKEFMPLSKIKTYTFGFIYLHDQVDVDLPHSYLTWLSETTHCSEMIASRIKG